MTHSMNGSFSKCITASDLRLAPLSGHQSACWMSARLAADASALPGLWPRPALSCTCALCLFCVPAAAALPGGLLTSSKPPEALLHRCAPLCRSPEECPADVEAIIARCLDSDPDRRPSARELVEFMVHLPQQLSLDGTGTDGSNDLSSSESPHLHSMHRQHGRLDVGSTPVQKGSCKSVRISRYVHHCGPLDAGPPALCRVMCLICGQVHAQAWAQGEVQWARTGAQRCLHPARAIRL